MRRMRCCGPGTRERTVRSSKSPRTTPLFHAVKFPTPSTRTDANTIVSVAVGDAVKGKPSVGEAPTEGRHAAAEVAHVAVSCGSLEYPWRGVSSSSAVDARTAHRGGGQALGSPPHLPLTGTISLSHPMGSRVRHCGAPMHSNRFP